MCSNNILGKSILYNPVQIEYHVEGVYLKKDQFFIQYNGCQTINDCYQLINTCLLSHLKLTLNYIILHFSLVVAAEHAAYWLKLKTDIICLAY